MSRKRDRILNFLHLSSPAPSEPPSPRASSNAGPTTSTRPSAATQQVTVMSSAHAASSTAVPRVASSSLPEVQLTPTPFSTGSSANEVAGVAWEGIKTALVLLKESSDWLPQLKAATGGLVALIGAIELTSANAADLEMLCQKLGSLTSIIKENSQDRTFPWLCRRLSEFAEKLDELVKNIEEKSNHGGLRRFAEGKKDREDIIAFAGAISDLVSNLLFQLTLYTSRGINELLSNESLKKLKASEMACYDALLGTKLTQRRGCTPKTRQMILEDLMKWAKDPLSSRMYWMNGMAGTGKTTIAYTFCEQLQDNGLLGANFFCSRSLAECRDIRYIIPTIACQLARSCPQFAPMLLKVLGGDFHVSSLLTNQLRWLLSEPFRHNSDPVTDTLIIVIDALDECNNDASDTRSFLEQICKYFSTNTIPLKVFVTSRPEDAIRHTINPLKSTSPSEWSIVHIHDIERSLVQADIKFYVEDELTEIAKTRRLEGGWPPSTEVDVIVANANRLFIYAATVIRYVKGNSGNPRRRLTELASTSRVKKEISQNSSLTTELIDDLYRTILERALSEKNQEEDQVARMVLRLIVCAQTPLTFGGIADLLNVSGQFEIQILPGDVRNALELLPSVISTPMDDDGVATTFHASFPDFLFDSHRCGSVYHIPFRQSHQDLASMCLQFMHKSLTVDNICGSDRWQSIDVITEQQKIRSFISTALAYACMFWASHIDAADAMERLSKEVDRFLTRHLLRWLEALGLSRRLDIGVEVLKKMKECKLPTLSSKFDDAYKFLKDVYDIINVWPSEVFHSGLVWAPEQSFIRNTYPKPTFARIVCGHRASWNACELTIRRHSGSVSSVAVSPDNRHIISGSVDETIRIWNSSTGEEEYVLQGHSGPVNSVAVSPDNRHIVSGSSDKTVRIWNASTGKEEHVLRGHSDRVLSVAVSPNNCHCISGSVDETVRIWNSSTGIKEHVLRGHSDWVNSVAVSPDNCHVVSGSSDKTIRIWNASTGIEEHVLRGHSQWVTSVCVSPDKCHIVSGSQDKTIRIWNASTGEEENVFRGHSYGVNFVAVSPDNRHVVSGSQDETVRIWNASTGKEEHVLRGHSDRVASVAVSPDNRHVVSGSQDKTIRIWNATPGEGDLVLQGHSGGVNSIAVSPDNCHVVSGSSDKTVRIWNASTGKEEHVLQRHSYGVNSVAVSPDNRHVISGSVDETVRIWNASTGNEEHVLRGHSGPVNSITFSPNNRHVVSGSVDQTVRIWNSSTGKEEHVLRGHSGPVNSITISPNNHHVVSGSADATVRIWNASTGKEEHVLRGHSDGVTSVAVSPDSHHVVSGFQDSSVRIYALTGGEKYVRRGHSDSVRSVAVLPGSSRIISGSADKTVRIWNTLTGKEERVFRGYSDKVTSVAVLSDDRHVGSQDRTVRIWNASTGKEEHVLRGHSDRVTSVAASLHDRHVVSGSKDKTVRIWNASTGDEEQILRGHSDKVTSVTVSSDNQHVVSGSKDKTIRMWNTWSGQEERIFRGHSDGVTSVAVSPGDRHVVSGSKDKTVRIWNASTGEEEHVLRWHSDSVTSVAVSPNFRVVSGSKDKTIRIWNAWTGERVRLFRGHSDRVTSVTALHYDLQLDDFQVVSGSSDKTIRIWGKFARREERVIQRYSDWVKSVAVSPEDRVDKTDVPALVISFAVSSDSCRVVSGHVQTLQTGQVFNSSMVTSVALLAQGDDLDHIPVLRQLLDGEGFDLDVLLQAVRRRVSPVPITLAPDGLSILLSNGRKCLAIPSALRDISCAAFSGSKVCFGHESGRITILDISS